MVLTQIQSEHTRNISFNSVINGRTSEMVKAVKKKIQEWRSIQSVGEISAEINLVIGKS